jgi:hypothetical protein
MFASITECAEVKKLQSVLAVSDQDQPERVNEPDPKNLFVIEAFRPKPGANISPQRPIPPYAETLGGEIGNLSVDWVTPETIAVGREMDCELVVRNRGAVAVEQLVIEPTLPKGFKLLKTTPGGQQTAQRPSWRIDKLAPQEEARISLRLLPEKEGDAQSYARVTFSTSSSANFRVVEPKLKIEVETSESVVVGDQAIFTATLSNPGSGKAENARIDVNLPDGLVSVAKSPAYDLGVLNPGESRSIRIVADVTQLGHHMCKFVATADGGLRDEDSKQILGLGAKLNVSIEGPQFRYVTRPANYTVRVTNEGTARAENVSLRCAVPKAFAFLEAEQKGAFDAASKNVNWLIGQLDVGEEVEVEFKLRAVDRGIFPICAYADAERGLYAESQHITQLEGISAILLEVVDVDDPVEVGTETLYEILVTNQGTEFAEGVRVTAKVPDGMKIIDSIGPSQGVIEGQTIRFAALPKLAPRADAIYRFQVQGSKPGDFRIEVQATADTLEAPVTELESTKYYEDAGHTPSRISTRLLRELTR